MNDNFDYLNLVEEEPNPTTVDHIKTVASRLKNFQKKSPEKASLPTPHQAYDKYVRRDKPWYLKKEGPPSALINVRDFRKSFVEKFAEERKILENQDNATNLYADSFNQTVEYELTEGEAKEIEKKCGDTDSGRSTISSGNESDVDNTRHCTKHKSKQRKKNPYLYTSSSGSDKEEITSIVSTTELQQNDQSKMGNNPKSSAILTARPESLSIAFLISSEAPTESIVSPDTVRDSSPNRTESSSISTPLQQESRPVTPKESGINSPSPPNKKRKASDSTRSIPDDDSWLDELFSNDTSISSDQSPASKKRRYNALKNKARKLEKMIENSRLASLKKDNRYKTPHKTRHEINHVPKRLPNKTEVTSINKITEPEIILSVAFYNQHRPAQRMQEFLVLGSQPLTKLRDKFYCKQDFVRFNVSQEIDSEERLNVDLEKKSPSYFFIENTFYNDRRDPDSLDYSKNIINWVNENNRFEDPKLGQYQVKVMGETKFIDLSIRLNEPYLFCHQGNCQHAVIFRDLRLLEPDMKYEDLNADNYPKAIFRSRIQHHKCRLCKQRPADYVLLDDINSLETPCYWCHNCFVQFHYYDNKLVYGVNSFKIFHYQHED
ncbi:765_t:CDS:2 [Ambispora leptoticha]|uniref:765_t:CDS:1 n=1 Tax=Ambispora leptoticha TaxID=144679 RepID=A0A9N9F933_9GLOM|nr:765_t:CDS:2 [Ambispora leptoticha]